MESSYKTSRKDNLDTHTKSVDQKQNFIRHILNHDNGVLTIDGKRSQGLNRIVQRK